MQQQQSQTLPSRQNQNSPTEAYSGLPESPGKSPWVAPTSGGLPGYLELGHHVSIVGQNESGKTTTAIVLLERVAYRAPVMVIDTKPEEDLEQLYATVYIKPEDALAANDWITIYRPDDEYNDPDQIEQFIRAFYAQERPEVFLYIDETYHAVRSSRADVGVANILMRGRKRMSRVTGQTLRMSVIASSQRPRWIPLAFWSESKHFYAHFLEGSDDRKTLCGYIGWPELIVQQPARGHEFYYYFANTEDIQPRKYQWRL